MINSPPIKILIVEDEGIVAYDLRRRLERLGFAVAGIADTGEGALELVRATQPQLVLMDIILQGAMDGIEVTERMRHHYDIPVVFLTAHSDNATLQRAKRTTPYGYLIKPFEERELHTAIEMALFRHAAEGQQRLYQRAIETAAFGIIVTAADPNYFPPIEANFAFDRMIGLGAGETIGRKTWLDELCQKTQADTIRQAMTDRHAYSITAQMRRNDTTPFWCDLSLSPVCDKTGMATHFIWFLNDITDRKQAEAAQRESEERFRMLADNSSEVFWFMAPNPERVLYVSPAVERIWGLPAKRFYADASTWISAIHAEDQKRVCQLFEAFRRGRSSEFEAEYRVLRPDGTSRWVQDSGTPIRNESGEIVQLSGVARDITQRKIADELIREQAALLDKAQDAICLNDMSQQILYWNKGAERLYGWTAAEAIGKNANDLLFQGDVVVPMEAIRNLIRKGEWNGELNQVTKTGQKLVIESRWTLMRADDGQPKSILIINTDITEKKQGQAKLLRTQRMESIGALAGGVAHDLNNALAPILMAADMLRDELPTEESRRLLDTMKNSAQRGADMVRQILSFSRGLTGEHAVIQIKHLITELVNFTKSTFPRSIRIESDITGQLLPVLGDATQINQILMNLCINARDAMPEGGSVRIEASNTNLDDTHSKKQSRGPHVVLTITDSGSGMTPEVMSKIFEPFFTTKEIGKGTGLGLSTVVEIVKSHHGFLEVSSELNKGTSFRVFLPATANHIGVEPKRKEPPAGSGELILLVDDETAILEMSKLMFEAHNYRIITAPGGVEAINCFKQRHQEIKAVITDMMMPNMNGPELIRELLRINPAVKIIGVSGHGSEAVMNESGRTMVHTFLSKPYSTELLLVKLREHLVAE